MDVFCVERDSTLRYDTVRTWTHTETGCVLVPMQHLDDTNVSAAAQAGAVHFDIRSGNSS